MFSSKTGLYPQDEIPFEEIPAGKVVDNKPAKIFRSDTRLNVDKETLTKIQNKKNVEKQIEAKEKAMEKGILHIIILVFNYTTVIIIISVKKETTSLENLIAKYTENPTYGPTKKLEGELKAANQKLKRLESDLAGLRSYHDSLINIKGNDTLRLVAYFELLLGGLTPHPPVLQWLRCQWLSHHQQIQSQLRIA